MSDIKTFRIHSDLDHKFAPSEEQIKVFAEMYNTQRKLPMKKIRCTVSGEMTTMFGNNLHGRVEKYGGIENLLRYFVCRKARSSMAVKEPLPGKKNPMTTPPESGLNSSPELHTPKPISLPM